jgi:hypothetical protein
MFDTVSVSNGVKLALLEGQPLTREIDRATFLERAANLGLPAPAIGDAADKFMAIAANQAARRATLSPVMTTSPLVPAPPARLWRDASRKTRMLKYSCSKQAARI